MSLLWESDSTEPVLLKGREKLKRVYRPVSCTCTNQARVHDTRCQRALYTWPRQRRREELRVVCGKRGRIQACEEIHQSKTGESERRAKTVQRKVGQITKHREDSRFVLGPLDMAVVYFRRKIFQQSPTETHPKSSLLGQQLNTTPWLNCVALKPTIS